MRPTIITEIPRASSSSLNVPSEHATSHNAHQEEDAQIHKSVLRLDAFLGEWLTPGYFELITPPPGSGLMIASAKAELLRREDYNNYPHLNAHAHHHVHSNSSSGQMWGMTSRGSSLSAHPGNGSGSEVHGLENLSSMAGALPRNGSIISSAGNSSYVGAQRAGSPNGGYVAPVPAYAISRSAEIPRGFVPHARDNCCDIDYQWDSMRGAMDWGDGGQYGEEWTEMHRRFRKGLQCLVDWYSAVENPTEMVTKERRGKDDDGKNDDECAIEDYEEEETESVVILVSHGAGCNALIGAITHQPVLMDVGLASLTMAVRKPEAEGGVRFASTSQNPRDASLAEFKEGSVPVHQYYNLEIFANTEHLHTQTPTASRHASIASVNRGRHSNTLSSPLAGVFASYEGGTGTRSSSATANLGSMRRSSGPTALAGRILWNNNGTGGGITVGSGVTSFTKPSDAPRSPSLGLWSPLPKSEESMEDDEDSFLPNFANSDPASKPTNGTVHEGYPISPSDRISPFPDVVTPPVEDEVKPTTPGVPQLGSGAGGLWGNPLPPGDAELLRDMSSMKRRWTVNERA